MTCRVLVVGNGVLADQVCQLLSFNGACDVTRMSEVPSKVPVPVDVALVLDDAWDPSAHIFADEVFRPLQISWLRGYVVLGYGIIGPLVHPSNAGCAQCADLRLLMADSDRRELLRLKTDLTVHGGSERDAWATRTALAHMAGILASETQRFLHDANTCQVVDHVIRINLKTLDTTRHFILPDGQCPTCGTPADDSAEAAVIRLGSVPKESPRQFRRVSLRSVGGQLVHDYLDYDAGLLNGRAHDLITPFAAVGVNLPLLIGDEGTSGRSHSYKASEPIAILEGLERFCGLEPRGRRMTVHGSYSNLQAHALNPLQVGLHAPEQYARADFPFRAFAEEVETDWAWGYSLIQQRPILVPQRLAYYSLGCQSGFVYETSNGCALGSHLVEAIFHGILEVVERDAFLMTWYARLPLPRIDLASCPDHEVQWMRNRIRAVTGYDLLAYNATMENGIPTVFVIAKNRRSHGLNLLCSAGAHVDPIAALKGAIHESAGMLLRFDEKLETQRATYLRMLEDSSQVRQMDDHSMLYGLPEAQKRLDFLLDGARPVQTWEQAFTWNTKYLDLLDDVNHLFTIFKRLNLDVIVVNQTSPEIERNGLYCVKVLIPGMLPMTFGHSFTRLEHLPRVLQVPMDLGYTPRPLTRQELNPYPHPFP